MLKLIFLIFFVPFTVSELFTAVVDLEKLISTEHNVVNILDNYLNAEEVRLNRIREIKKKYQEIDKQATQNLTTYLNNPINSFILVKSLTTDWKFTEYLMINGSVETASKLLYELYHSSENMDMFPSTEDLNGVADALLRLQDTYQLETSNLADGNIPENFLDTNNFKFINNKLSLTSGDCFELGKHSYANRDYYYTSLWMQEALERNAKEHFKQSNKAEILEYLAYSTYQRGNTLQALKLTEMLLAEDAYNSRALRNKIFYENELRESFKLLKKRGDDNDENIPTDNLSFDDAYREKNEKTERDLYKNLCRGEEYLPQRIKDTLYCTYLDTKNIPYLRYTKIKIEIVYHNPYAVIYHDIISDNEIGLIKKLSIPRLRRATVQNSKTGDLEIANYRISKSAWLRNEDHETLSRLSSRIEMVTNLSTETAEELQVVNYGIGGHYEPHYDFARKEEKNAFKNLNTGNRIATWLTYLSDVEAGGATVFPVLGFGVYPKKGSALFWYNLYKSGEGNLLTRHAACPVLVGSKWVANKWFHERGQEFRRPCGLAIND